MFVVSMTDSLKSRWSHHKTVLIGNPSVSMSWFQWYITYCLVNQVRDQADVEDEFNEPIKVITHQQGSDIFDPK